MAKLYVFGIGGTGSRVLRSFTYLLASGVKLQGFSEVVPIIIDADKTAGDKTELVRLLRDYSKLYKMVDHSNAAFNESFFQTMISSDCQEYTMKIPGETSQTFKEYMKFRSLSSEDKAMVQMLFSEANLDAEMSVGFKGNPNIGSVVLNQFVDTDDFKSFANKFSQGDAIFIISSIFGGTGASGFLLLLKNLRSDQVQYDNFSTINKAQIGAITVLPYFNLESPTDGNTGQLDGSTFIQKTRAALRYYKDNLKELNHLYYIADDLRPSYTNCDGGAKQKNKPHFIEFVSALAIFDFAKHASSSNAANNVSIQTQYHEYGIKEDRETLNFGDMYDSYMYIKPMTKFLLMHNFIVQALGNSWKKAWASAHEPIFTETSLSLDGFWETLNAYIKGYRQWLLDMAENKRSFAPFNLHTDEKHVFDLVSGITPVKHGFLSLNKNYDRYNKTLDEIKEERRKQMASTLQQSCPSHWMDLFARVTEKLVNEELNIR